MARSLRCKATRGATLSPCQMAAAWGCLSRVPQPLHGGSSRIWSKAASGRTGARSVRAMVATWARFSRKSVWRRVVSRSFEGSLAKTKPVGPTSWARKPVLPPGAAHMSRTEAPGGGASSSGGSMDERSWMWIRPKKAAREPPSGPGSPVSRRHQGENGSGSKGKPWAASRASTAGMASGGQTSRKERPGGRASSAGRESREGRGMDGP